ncbi:MAG: hypothetical protein L3J33_09515 [Rhodobacteraceae bacterium]|nr:hypothetical protein [Paracoccaceae bacterium]
MISERIRYWVANDLVLAGDGKDFLQEAKRAHCAQPRFHRPNGGCPHS